MKNPQPEIMNDATWQKFCSLSPEKQKLARLMIQTVIDNLVMQTAIDEIRDGNLAALTDIEEIQQRQAAFLEEIEQMKENI